MSVPRIRCEMIATHPSFVALSQIDGILVDLRYASARNVFGRDVYAGLDCAWAHVDAAKALERSVAWLRVHAPGFQLLVLDALRPHRVQQTLWDELQDPRLRSYLADPQRGSIHSYGLAIDATLVDPAGREVDMGTAFDAMTELSHPALEDRFLASGELQDHHVANRTRLRSAMRAGGFDGIRQEWWHFDLHDRELVRAQGLRVD